jgi:hypothetical protein
MRRVPVDSKVAGAYRWLQVVDKRRIVLAGQSRPAIRQPVFRGAFAPNEWLHFVLIVTGVIVSGTSHVPKSQHRNGA